MRINHKFAPFTIEIETEEDKTFIIRVASLALDAIYSRNHGMFGGTRDKCAGMDREIESFINKIRGSK